MGKEVIQYDTDARVCGKADEKQQARNKPKFLGDLHQVEPVAPVPLLSRPERHRGDGVEQALAIVYRTTTRDGRQKKGEREVRNSNEREMKHEKKERERKREG